MKKIKFISAIFLLLFIACKKEEKLSDIDQQLYDMAKETQGYTWFRFSDAFLNKSPGSAHSQTFLRTRYNASAATMLDSAGRIKKGAKFPEGAVVVKELAETRSRISRYAVLFKNSSSAFADNKGWVWGYIDAEGTVSETAVNKGSACISCHSQGGNEDYMLMSKYFQ
jgi:hypothetical protein